MQMSGKFEKRLASAKGRHAKAIEKLSSPLSPPRLLGAAAGGAVGGGLNALYGPQTTAIVGIGAGLVSLALSPKLKAAVGEFALASISAAIARKSEEITPKLIASAKSKVSQLTAAMPRPAVQASSAERIAARVIDIPEATPEMTAAAPANGTHKV